MRSFQARECKAIIKRGWGNKYRNKGKILLRIRNKEGGKEGYELPG